MPNEGVPNDAIVAQLNRVSGILVEKKYENLDAAAPGSRVRSEDLARVIKEYGRTVVGVETDDISIVPLKGDEGWSVWANLLTAEEGKSDLVLVTRIVRISQPPFYKVFIDDLRVP
jgi:hypothetical protein